MDSSFTKRFNSYASRFNANPNNFVQNLAMKQNNAINNAFSLIKDEEKEYRNFLYEYEKAKFIYDNANEIYAHSENPREEANANNLSKIINALYPSVSVETARKNYRGIIKGITGDDMSATNVMQVFGKTFKNNMNSLFLGARILSHSYINKFFESGLPEEVEKKRDEDYKRKMDEIKFAKGLNQRTDYYNRDFDSFLQQAVISSATILPSMIFSLGPEIAGAAVSAITANPLFYSIGHGVSAASAAFMEAGGMAFDLYEAGADWDTIRGFSAIVGAANGALEIIGNIPEARINKALFGMQKLKRAVGAEASREITRGLASTVFKKMALNYGLGLVTEPGTEALQELVSMYGMNLASKWEETHKGKSFTDEFTYTKQEMVDTMKEIAVSVFKGQMLLGLVGEGVDLYTNLRKGGKFLYNENTGTGLKWDTGDLRKIMESRKYSTFDKSSVFTDSNTIVTNSTTKAYSPKETDEKGLPKEKVSPVKVRSIGGEFVPVNSEEMAKAKYIKTNSEGMYIDIVQDTSKEAESIDAVGVKQIINDLPDEINKRVVEYEYTDKGDIVVPSREELNTVVRGYVSDNIDKVENVFETDNGYTVTIGGKNVNFTTEADNSVRFSQSDYVRTAKDASDKKKKEFDSEWQRRSEQLVERAKEIQSKDKRYKTSIFRKEINKVVDSMITDKDKRDIEKKRINDHVTQISKEVEKATESAIKNSPKSAFAAMFKGKNTADASKSVARGVVMAAAKLAQSMNMNVSQFLSKMTFSFSENTLKEGKERAGWTEVHPDGIFDVKITSLFDQTTGIHEIGHVYLSMLGDNYKSIEGFEQNFKSEIESDGGKVGRNTQEAFARALEAYVNENMAKSEGLRKVFNLVLDALRNFVNAVRDLLSPEKVAMFDNLFEKGLKDYKQSDVEYGEEIFYAKDADDYSNDYEYNSGRMYDATKNGNTEISERIKKVTEVFSSGVLDYIKDEYGEDVDIVKVDDNNVEMDFLDGTAAAELVSKFIDDPLASTYNDSNETDVTIFLPSGDTLTLAIMARTDTRDFIFWRSSYIRDHLQNKTQSEEQTRKSFVSKMFEDIEREAYGRVERITYAGGASRYRGPEYNQSTRYINSGEGAQVFGWGLYESALMAIAKHYADHVSASKGFGMDDVQYTVSKFFRDYFESYSTKGPAALRKTYFTSGITTLDVNNDVVDLYNLGDLYRQIIEKNYEKIMNNGKTITKDDVLSEIDSIISNIEDKFRSEKIGDNIYEWFYGDKNIGKSESSKEQSLSEIRKIRDDIVSNKINLTTKPVKIDKKPDNVAKTIHTNIISGDDSKFIPWEEDVDISVIDDVIDRVSFEKNRTGNDYDVDVLYDFAGSFIDKTGMNLYAALTEAMGNSDRAASMILKDVGYEGIKYQADSRGGNHNDGYNYVIFDDAFVNSIREEELDENGNVIADRRWEKNVSPIYFKDADLDMDEADVLERLNHGGFVPNEVLDKFEDENYVKVERLVQNIVGTKPEWFKLYKRAEDNYLLETGKTFDKLNGGDKKHILDDWNKRLKGASEYMEVPENGDWIRLINRMHAYAEMESPERADTAFTDSLNHTRNGRENIRNLAVEMDKLGLFKDTLEGYNLSSRFPALSLIAQKTKSSEKRGTRPRIDVSVYDQAKDEAFRNRQFIREQMNDENTNAYESNAREADTNTNYIETEDIQSILKEKGISSRVKEIVKDGIWSGTVVRDLMEETSKQLNELNASNRTIESTQRELDIERERAKIYEAEIAELEKGISKKNAAKVNNLKSKLSEAKSKIYNLELQNKLLADMVALERLDAALYRTKRQVQDLVKKNTGEADVSRALRKAVNSIINFTKKARAKNPNLEVKIDLNRMKYNLDEEGNIIKDADGNPEKGKAPTLAKFLEENGFVDKDGKLIKGFEDMNVGTLKAFKSAVKTDKENSIDRQRIKQREFNTNIQNLANKIVSSMRSRKIEKNLTNEDKQRIREEVDSQSEGKNLDRSQLNDLERQITGKIVAEKIKEIADGARYGIESHTEAVGKKHVLDDFTTLSRLLGAISPELRQFVMDGLNKATDGRYRNVESRMKTFYSNIKAEYNLKTDKDVRNFFNKVVNTRQEIGRVSFDEIPERLKKNKLFMEMWDADEKTGDNKKPAKFQYSIQDLMAIEEQSLEWDGLRHLNKGCGVTAAEIAWTVREFETENGSLNYYKAAADEIRRVYGERFQELYDTVLNVENREMVKVSFYSPMFGVGLNKDLMMKFSDVFGDDRTAQANWFTKDREFGTNAIDLSYYSRLEKVVEMQEAYINGAEFYKQLNHLFSEDGGNLRNIITEVYDASTFKRIETILDLTKTDAVRNVITEADNMASTIRNHYVMARLSYNFSSVLQQIGSWFLGLRDYGLGQMWKASIQFIMHPIEMSNRVYELSPQLKHNVNPLLQMAKESMKTNPKTALGKVDKFVTSIGEKGLILMEKQDHIIRNILFWTAYQSELSKAQAANKGAELTYEQKDKCQRNATQWVLDIQSSSQVKDNSLMYSGNNLFWKQVLIFTNQLNKEWNMFWVDGLKEGLFQKQYGKFFANFAALGLATMWIVAITGKIKNDEDDDESWLKDLLKDWGIEFITRAPLVGNTVKNVYEGFAYRQNDDIVTRLTQAINTLASEKATTKKKVTALKNFGWSGLDLFGAPTTAIKRISQSLEDGEITQADHFMRLFGGEWYKYFEE